MAQPIKTSAAGRLLRIIKALRGADNGKPTFEAWAVGLGIPSTHRADVFEGITGLYRLIDDSKRQVAAHPELDQQLYLGALANIEAAIAQAPLHVNWGSHAAQFTGANVLALQFVAEQLDRLSDETELPTASLEELRLDIERVIAEVLKAELDPELRKTLIAKLEDARHAVLFYVIDGADGLRRAAESAIGSIILARESVGPAVEKKPLLDYVRLVNALLDLVEKARPFAALFKPAIRTLLAATSSSDAL